MALDFMRQAFVGLDHLTQKGDLSEIRAKLIVQIAGNAGALVSQRLLLPKRGELALQPLGGDVIYRADDDAEQAKGRDGQEPGRPPEWRQNRHGQSAAGLIPNSIFVAGRHLKAMVAWRQRRILS